MRGRILLLLLLVLGCNAKTFAQADTLHLQHLEQRARATYSTDPDSSKIYAELIVDACEQHDHVPAHAFALNWIGIAWMRRGEADSAEFYYQKTVDYCESQNEENFLLKARLNRAMNYFQQGQFESSATASEEALTAFQAAGDTLGVAHAQYNLGNCLFRLDRHDEALTFYKAAETVYQSKGRPIENANLANALGSIMNEIGKLDSAIHYHRIAANIKTALAGSYLCSSEFNNMATSFKEMGQIDSASHYYHRSMRAAQELEDGRAYALATLNLAGMFVETSTFDSSFHYATIGAAYADATGDLFLEGQAALKLSRTYYGLGQADSAYKYRILYDDISDSLQNIEIAERIAILEKEYRLAESEREFAEQNLQLSEQENEVQRQTLFTLYVSLAALVLAALGTVLFVRFRKRKQLELERAALAVEQEKTRIAMDLHDHLGAELTLITSRLDTTAFQSNRESEKEALENIASQVRKANSTLRETVWSVRADSITVEQLLDRIDRFANQMLADTETSFEIQASHKEKELAPNAALAIYRLLQEGITNAFKHASASKIELVLNMDQEHLKIALTDNGVGFSEAKSQGYGLENMQTRTAQLNGKLEMDGSTGCTLVFTFPADGLS